MTVPARPGQRLLIKGHQIPEPCTLGGVCKDGNSYWGVTAGHALQSFDDQQVVSYFPNSLIESLGTYARPVALDQRADLAKFQIPEEQVAFEPLGFALPPKLFPQAQLATLIGNPVTFLGGQVGRTGGTLTAVGPQRGYQDAILVEFGHAMIIGDSGGPLYLEDGNNLFWIGTLVQGWQTANPNVAEGLFLHPAPGLAALGLQ